ncbi:MAG: TPR end-of-group domain-containing protein [Thermoguttaceae bacterium]
MSIRKHIRQKQIEREAEGYLELGMPQRALEALNKLGGEAELSLQGLYLRGEALRWLERYEEALPFLEKAAQALPEDIHVWLALGWCYKRTGRIDRAVEAMQQALKAKPREALLHYNLACYLSLAGQRERALEHLAKAFALDPEYRQLVPGEPDFDPLRSDPQFQALLDTSA